MEQGTATGDIAAGDPPSDLASSVPALILPTPADGPDPPDEDSEAARTEMGDAEAATI